GGDKFVPAVEMEGTAMRGTMIAIAAAALFGVPPAADAHGVRYGSTVIVSHGYPAPWYYPAYYYAPYYFGSVWVRPWRARTERRERGAERALKLYVYPAAGQSEEQLADDRYECHVWAAEQSGHDPTLGAGSRREAEEYTRAFTACMEGRNYVVR